MLVGTSSYAMAIDPAAGRAYIANYYTNNITVISTSSHNQVVTIPVGIGAEYPTNLLDDSTDGLILVLSNPYWGSNTCEAPCPGNGTVTAFSTSTNAPVGQVAVGTNPEGFVFSSHSDEAFVSNLLPGTVSVISPQPFGLKATLSLATYSLIADPANSAVYALETGLPGNVTVINGTTNSIAAVIGTGGSPYMGVYDPWNRILYVGDGNRTQDWIDVISTVTDHLVTEVDLPGQDFQMTVDSLTGNLLVGTDQFTNERQFYGGNFTVISRSTNAVLQTIPWSPYVYAVISDNATGAVYFLGEGNLTVFNATTMSPAYSAPVNRDAYEMALDTSDDTLWVLNPSFYIGVPGSVDIYKAPWPISSSGSPAGVLGWTDLPAPVLLGSVVAGALIGSLTWFRARGRR